MTTERMRAMNGVELAIRRVSDRLKQQTPWNMGLTNALDEIADEILNISSCEDEEIHAQPGAQP